MINSKLGLGKGINLYRPGRTLATDLRIRNKSTD